MLTETGRLIKKKKEEKKLAIYTSEVFKQAFKRRVTIIWGEIVYLFFEIQELTGILKLADPGPFADISEFSF